jgi:O-antigen/teichoic acid export membrane protein
VIRGDAGTPPVAVPAGVLAGSQYLAAGVSFLSALLVARWLGPGGYGAAALVMAYPTLVWSLAAVKSITVVTRDLAARRASREREQVGEVCAIGYGMDMLSGVAALVIVGATAPWAARSFGLDGGAWLSMVYAAAIPLASLRGTSLAVLTSWERFGVIAALQVFDPALTLVLVASAIAAGLGVPGVILGTAASRAALGVASTAVAVRVLRREGITAWWRAPWPQVVRLLRELRAAFGWSYLAASMGAVITQLPIIILGRGRGPEEAGYYRLAAGMMTVGSHLEGAMSQVAYPALTARRAGGEGVLRRLTRDWTLWPGLPAAAAVLATIPLLQFVIPALLGAGFAGAVSGAQVMLLGVAGGALLFWLNAYHYAAGRFDLVGMGAMLHGLLIAVLGWTVGERWGFIGLAVLATLGKVAALLWLLGMTRRSVDVARRGV